jgi:hypothetical protein
MSVVELGDPPQLGAVRYSAYRPWLLERFYFRLCSYCLLRHLVVHVDHYEPQSLAPTRVHDPTNLLLACEACNGRAGKHDYHPLHERRTRLPRDDSGHLVLDVRRDDLGLTYEVLPSGALRARPGVAHDRACWNVVLLNLDLPAYDAVRKDNLETLEMAEGLVSTLDSGVHEEHRPILEVLLDKLVRDLARQRLFFHVFDIGLSERLSARVAAIPKEPK